MVSDILGGIFAGRSERLVEGHVDEAILARAEESVVPSFRSRRVDVVVSHDRQSAAVSMPPHATEGLSSAAVPNVL